MSRQCSTVLDYVCSSLVSGHPVTFDDATMTRSGSRLTTLSGIRRGDGGAGQPTARLPYWSMKSCPRCRSVNGSCPSRTPCGFSSPPAQGPWAVCWRSSTARGPHICCTRQGTRAAPLQHNRFTPKQINGPEAVLGVSEEGQPGRPTVVGHWAVVFGKDTP